MSLRMPRWAKYRKGRPLTAQSKTMPLAMRALGQQRPWFLGFHGVKKEPPEKEPPLSLPPIKSKELASLLYFLQRKDFSQIADAFVSWTAVLADHSRPTHKAERQEAFELPSGTFSEIVRFLDPFNTADDPAAGLKIGLGESEYTPLGNLVDQFGVRHRHRTVLTGMKTLFAIRADKYAIAPADYEVAIRASGAAADFDAVKQLWGGMSHHDLGPWRSKQLWNEFMKAFFLTDPLYYQSDRSRVAVQARSVHLYYNQISFKKFKRLEKLRLSINDLTRQPWNRNIADTAEEVTRVLRYRDKRRSFRSNWICAILHGYELDEKLLCTSLRAFARSGSRICMERLILYDFFGITINENVAEYEDIVITGGKDFPASSPLRPTAALLDAIADAYGSLSEISIAIKLIHFVSQRYSIPIPHGVFSNLLQWAYLSASKHFSTGYKMAGWSKMCSKSQAEALAIWTTMTTGDGAVTPTFDDYDIYIKILAIRKSPTRMLDSFREFALPYYAKLVEAFEMAVADEVLQAEALGGPAPQPVVLRRQKAQILKEDTHHRITIWFKTLLRAFSECRNFRNGQEVRIRLPSLVRDHLFFFPDMIRYRTSHGRVCLHMQGDEAKPVRMEWEKRFRGTLETKMGSMFVRLGDLENDVGDNPTYHWPRHRSMRVLETRPVPRMMLDKIPPPPKEASTEGKKGEAKGWWEMLEEELVL